MSDPRYVISQELPCGGGEFCSHDYRPCPVALEPVLDLPDAEHIHVTRHPDGTITATPMAEQTFPQPTWEAIARLFHRNYEDLAPEFGYVTRPESAIPWADVPEQNRALMIATVGQVLRDLRDRAPLWVDCPTGGDMQEPA